MNEVFVSILKTAKAIQDYLKQHLRKYGISQTEFAVLEVLYEHKKQTVHQIAGKVFLANGSMTYVIDKLVEKGYVLRTDCREDRRVVHVEMANEGRSLMDELHPFYKKIVEGLFSDITEDEQKITVQTLNAVESKAK